MTAATSRAAGGDRPARVPYVQQCITVNGEPVPCTPIEAEILRKLVRGHSAGPHNLGMDRSRIGRHVRSLRQKLPEGVGIRAEYGTGRYWLEESRNG